MKSKIHNINVVAKEKLPSPKALKATLPLTRKASKNVLSKRNELMSILDGKDSRLVVVVGPCSIHDTDLAKDYASRLKNLSKSIEDTLLILMRVYFEKPRTTTGWKGLINDPDIDDTFQIDKGIHIARSLLIDLNEMGLGIATEALDPIMPQYLGDLTSWTAIGARTTESQTHREMASGLSTPVGFKNGTDGSLSIAINAIHSSRQSHHFLGLDDGGRITVYQTKGNKYSHVVLRGGAKPNYDSGNIRACEKRLNDEKLPNKIMVDCSHGNTNKDYALQPKVAKSIANQIKKGNKSIMGLMIESNINEGNQKITEDLNELKYGVSLTDACINWETTEELLLDLREAIISK